MKSLVLALLLVAGSASAQRVAVLLAENRLAGEPRFWWHCGAAEPSPFVDAWVPHLERSGIVAIARCATPQDVHSSFHHPDLSLQAALNVSGALDATLTLYGTVRYETGQPLPTLGLQHIRAELRATIANVDSGRTTGELSVVADGYASDIGTALDKARDILLLQVIDAGPALLSAAPTREPRLRVEVDVGGRVDQRLAEVTRLRAVTGVTLSRLYGVTSGTTLVEVSPPSVRYAVASALAAAGVSYRFVD